MIERFSTYPDAWYDERTGELVGRRDKFTGKCEGRVPPLDCALDACLICSDPIRCWHGATAPANPSETYVLCMPGH